MPKVSASFIGTSYDTLTTAASQPTTLEAILDRWLTSAGAIDFKVDVNGVAADQQRPDLLIITTAGNILADVVGYHPTCKSALASSSRADAKTRKYENAAIHHRFSFTPFVSQTIGGLADDAVTSSTKFYVYVTARPTSRTTP